MRRLALTLALVVGNLACRGPAWTPEPLPAREPAGLAAPELVAFMPEDDISPRASADGRYVAFVSGQNGNLDIWVRDYARRSTYPLTLDGAADYDPDVAPRGDKLVFVSRRSDAKGDLYLVHGFDTGAAKERLTHEGSRDRQPTFAPDGRRIFFTQAFGVGDEAVAVLDLETRDTRRVSPGPGFDPAVAPDGRFLVYTEPGVGRAQHPHLVALRLTDGATRAVTAPDVPAGFARFAPAPAPGVARLVFNRFPDDDDASGHLDAEDRASLWRLDVHLEQLFAGQPAALSRPFPLTDGAADELFADVAAGFIYFTQGSLQQDIFRLPLGGLFPEYGDAAEYFALAETLEDPRTRWFAYRAAWATAPRGGPVEAQALLAIGRLQEERGRPDMAADAYRQLLAATADAVAAEGGGARAQLHGLGQVALASLERQAQVAAAAGPEDRARATAAAMVAVGRIAAAHPGSPAVQARVELERAEILVDRGARVQAAEDLEALVQRFPTEAETAARAMLFRIDLLGVAYAPEAIGEAYRRVLERFPGQRAVVREAAGRIVEAHLGRLDTRGEPRAELDALRRLVDRYGPGPVRSLARWQVVQRMEALGLWTEAGVELERLIAEAGTDRLAEAQALRRLARLEERVGRGEPALEAWRTLRRRFGDLPGFGAEARESITRVSQAQARALEEAGDFEGAREAYRRVIENDLNQVEAHRRFFALSARVGRLEEALEEAEVRAARSAQTPVAHYAYGLGLTWTAPPRLGDALAEVERALALNPQLVHAYITRGWIREMQELEEPSFFTRAKDAVVEGVGRALGGLLDVEIGQQGLLEQALEDYKTALRLNPESVDAVTEAQILLNLGNGHYRLAEKTNDVGNMRAAFERYLEAWRLGLAHRDPRTELVFYERLGRAASWVDEPAVGAMATRRALVAAKAAGVERRDAQLYGNLALTYTLAGEDAYARDALARFEAFRAQAEARSGLVVAARDRARARLDTLSARDAAQLEGILADLATGRRWLDGLAEMDRGDLPSLWLALNPDASRAQFGFDRKSEADLNLSMAESAHRALGEVTRAQDVRRLRAGLTAQIIEEVPGVALGFGDQYPTPLGPLRERLGLRMADVRARHAEGRPEEAEAALASVQAELEGWLGDDRYAADHPALRVDLGRLAALAVELYVARPPTSEGPPPPKLPKGGRPPQDRRQALDALLGSADRALAAATATAARPLDTGPLPLPDALDTPEALVATASAALGLPRWAGVEREVRAVRARLAYARALLALKDLSAPGAPDAALPALLADLDQRLAGLTGVRAHLVSAALSGAEAGPGLGLRVSALALAALADVERVQGRGALADAAVAAAAGMARAAGELRLHWRVRLGAALAGPGAGVNPALAELSGVLPHQVGADLAPGLFVRSASAALARGELSAAFAALDRSLLFTAAAGPLVEPRAEGIDPELARTALRTHAVLAEARAALARADARTPPERYEALRGAVTQAWAQATRAVPAKGVQDLAALRLFGRAREPEELEFELGPREALLMAAPLDGALHLFLVDGSTTAADKWAHAVAEGPAAQVIRDLAAVRESLAGGRRASPNRVGRLQKALLAPLAPRLTGKRHLYVVSTALGGPLPLVLFDPQGPVPCHLSAPSLLAVVKAAQLVGVAGRLAVADPAGRRSWRTPAASVRTRCCPSGARGARPSWSRARAGPWTSARRWRPWPTAPPRRWWWRRRCTSSPGPWSGACSGWGPPPMARRRRSRPSSRW
jgi:tetratricopeptide (TPR) repeat protein